ncbi:MAG: hypothetical protein ACRD59_05850 [Candidatus Acidiferrales bacterium]
MADPKPKTFFSGAALVWRRQRVLWLLYIVNFVLATVGTFETKERVGKILNHRLAADQLLHGFNLGAFISLWTHPETPFASLSAGIFHSAILFTLFMLFATGGILAAYYSGQRLKAGPFFEACGHHFWRFLRLTIYLLIVLVPVGALGKIASSQYNRIDTGSISPMPAVHFMEATIVVVALMLICIRIWFDMAQVIAVAEDERRMHKALRSAASLLRHNFGSLFWLYFRVSLVGWIVFGFGVYFWIGRLAPESTGAAFVLSQFMILVWLSTRLWQRASESIWFREHQRAIAAVPAYEPPAVPPMPVISAAPATD